MSKYKSHVNCWNEQAHSPTMTLTIVTGDVIQMEWRTQPTKHFQYKYVICWK